MDSSRIKIGNFEIEDPSFFNEKKSSENDENDYYIVNLTNNKARKELQEEGNTLEISQPTVANIMATNRELYPELRGRTEDEEEIKKMPFRPKYRHHYWFIDIRYLVKINGKWTYSICILEGYSRCILSGMVSLSKDLWAVLIVLYSAVLRFGIPASLVSDNESVFVSPIFETICVHYAKT